MYAIIASTCTSNSTFDEQHTWNGTITPTTTTTTTKQQRIEAAAAPTTTIMKNRHVHCLYVCNVYTQTLIFLLIWRNNAQTHGKTLKSCLRVKSAAWRQTDLCRKGVTRMHIKSNEISIFIDHLIVSKIIFPKQNTEWPHIFSVSNS